MARITYLDALRAVAIIGVFWFHAMDATYVRHSIDWAGNFINLSDPLIALWPVTLGWAGVAIFFAVSGFCIHLSFLKSSGNFGEYFTRRFFRIYPPYLFALLLFCAVSYPGAEQFFTHLLLIHNFFPSTVYGISGAFWSIAVEVQLYLLYPLVILGSRRFGWGPVVVATLFLELTLRTIVAFEPDTPPVVERSPFIFLFSWSVGAYAAQLIVEKRNPAIGWSAVISAFVLACASALTPFTSAYSFTLFALGTAGLMLQLHHVKFSRKLKPLSALGRDSYSFYLLHQPILATGIVLLGAYPWLPRSAVFLIGGLIMFPLIAVLSRAMRMWIEDPSAERGKTVAYRFGT